MKKYKIYIYIYLFVILLEIFVFNYKTYRVMSNDDKRVYQKEDFSVYEENDEYTYVEIDGINTEMKSFHIILDNAEKVEYQVLYTDSTSSEFRSLPKKVYVDDLKSSEYIDTYLSGDSIKIAVKIWNEGINNIDVSKVIINERIPFNFSSGRVLILYCILVFAYWLKKLDIFKMPYSKENWKQKLILVATLCTFIVLILLINASCSAIENKDYYYFDFVNALLKKQLFLDEKPSEALMNLENPYDLTERRSEGIYQNEEYIWDIALYNGKYYVYFGILPALILLVPYHIITGKYLASSTAVFIFSALTTYALIKLVKNIFEKFFRESPFKLMLYSIWILLFGSQILVLNGVPRFYEIAVISGMFFAISGLNFIFIALKNKRKNYIYLFLASLFLSASVACRPTMLLTSLIALPIFLKLIINDFKEKKYVKIVLSICIPYIIVGGILMYYNYIRFGSIFEFGAKYQLTVNDMRNVKNRFMTIGVGIIYNLFNIPHILPQFPFIERNTNIISFYGYYFLGDTLGGLFFLAPICFAILFINTLLRKDKKISRIVLLFSGVGLLMCIISIMMAGSICRYIADYAWILIIAGIMAFIGIWNIYKTEESKNILTKILSIIMCYTVIINLFAGIISEHEWFSQVSEKEYYKIKYTINFWE